MQKGIIILGSARSDGDCAVAVNYFQEITGFDVLDLKEKNIKHYDYQYKKNLDDDFNALFKELVTTYDILVFATPVYWYTMSGRMKVFFDRISDFLHNEKEYGRLLRGKTMGVISCSNTDDVTEEFEIPFQKSAAYLGMDYVGHRHVVVNETVLDKKSQESLNTLRDLISKRTRN